MARTKKGGKKDEPAAAAAGAAAAAAADDAPSTSYDASLPASLEEQRTRIVCKPDRNLHVRRSYDAGLATTSVLPGPVAHQPCSRVQAGAAAGTMPRLLLLDQLTQCRPVALPPPLQTTSTIAATQWASLGVDAAFDLARFKRGFDINITRYEGDDMEFEMKGVSCAVRALASDGGALKQGHLACVTAALSAEKMALH